MKDLENLKNLISIHRRGGRSPFPQSLKSQILEAAKVHGKTSVMKALNLSPSSFYKWSKQCSSKKVKDDFPKPATFVEITQSPKSKTINEKFEGHIKWEAVRPDGSILRCELHNQNAEISSVFNSFLGGGKTQ